MPPRSCDQACAEATIASAFCVRSDRHLATSAGVDGVYRRLAAKPSMAAFRPARAAPGAGCSASLWTCGVAQQGDGVAESRHPIRIADRTSNDLPAGLAQYNKMAGKIAAIHRGDIFRLQRAQVACIVPVVKMAAKALQLRHRGECALEPLQCVKRPQPAEIARGDDREEIQPQIGWRGAVSDDRFGILLKIVGRQHVVCRRDECFEEAPGAPGDQPQRQGVRRGDRKMTVLKRRHACPARDEGGQRPQEHERYRDRPASQPEGIKHKGDNAGGSQARRDL